MMSIFTNSSDIGQLFGVIEQSVSRFRLNISTYFTGLSPKTEDP